MKEKTCFSTAILEYAKEYSKMRAGVNTPSQSNKMLIRPKYDNTTTLSDCCMVVRVGEMRDVGKEKFFEFLICSTMNEHKEGTTEWHDLTWCGKWELITVL